MFLAAKLKHRIFEVYQELPILTQMQIIDQSQSQVIDTAKALTLAKKTINTIYAYNPLTATSSLLPPNE